jgi:hypothetical protein
MVGSSSGPVKCLAAVTAGELRKEADVGPRFFRLAWRIVDHRGRDRTPRANSYVGGQRPRSRGGSFGRPPVVADWLGLLFHRREASDWPPAARRPSGTRPPAARPRPGTVGLNASLKSARVRHASRPARAFLLEPGAGIRPVAVGRAGREAESGGGLVESQSGDPGVAVLRAPALSTGAIWRDCDSCRGVSGRSVRRGQGLSGLVGNIPTPLEEGG